MIKYIPVLLLAIGLLAYACQADQDPPEIQRLTHTEWEVTGYLSENAEAMHSSQVRYRLAFLSDSTFLLKLDANALTGNYTYGGDGSFQVSNIRKTQDCCDNEYALEMESIFKSASGLRLRQDKATLKGSGEVYLKRK